MSSRLVYITLENRETLEDACHIVHPLGFLFLSFIHFYTLMIAALVGRRQPLVPPARSISKRRQPTMCRNPCTEAFAAIPYSMTAPLQDAETLRWYLASQPLVALDGGAT